MSALPKGPNVNERTSGTPRPATRRGKRRRPTPDAFFEKNEGIRMEFLCEEIERDGQIAAGPHRDLYYYRDGIWVPDGEREVLDRTRILLRDRFRANYGSNAVLWHNVQPSPFDPEPNTDLLNLPNGLLDWRTGVLQDHDPNVGILPRVPVEWDADATCPLIEEWLRSVLPEDCIDLAFELCGYALYNGMPLHVAAMLLGEGRNGKGTFLRLLTKLVGEANVSSISPQQISEHRFLRAGLYGKLANLAGDVSAETFHVTDMFKRATGGDLIVAERKHGQPFEFRNRAFIIASFNEPPRSEDTTRGFFSRWVVVPFIGDFPEGVADSSVEDKIGSPAELRGLLVAAVEGLRRVIGRNEFTRAASVEAATATYRIKADPIREFVGDTYKPREGARVAKAETYQAWKAWADENGHRPESAQKFHPKFASAVIDAFGVALDERRYRGTQTYVGIRQVGPSVRSARRGRAR